MQAASCRLLLSLAASIAAISDGAVAQAMLGTSDLFGALRMPVACESSAVSRSDSLLGVKSAFQYRDGVNFTERLIEVGFAAGGAPLYLIAMRNIPTSTRLFGTHLGKVHFMANDQATGIAIGPDTTGAGADLESPLRSKTTELTSAQKSQARSLAVHLWSIRCEATVSKGRVTSPVLGKP